MQQKLCSSFSKFYPMVQACLIIDKNVYTDFFDKPLLHVSSEGQTVSVIFTRQTDMRHIDKCFKGFRPTFEEDMQEK